ncbi:hypothetical protein AMEX_G25199 [Astyanax mexicanus]|uniref:Immunoglobulin subtype domain-containing protein n=1 Tax=Astyanax mexicanus TaxID=7994 RepID=A0A8T2KUR6_ASTMX|nr:hypothetical protein AMEX_G25199 [Astyanax mexicanus]
MSEVDPLKETCVKSGFCVDSNVLFVAVATSVSTSVQLNESAALSCDMSCHGLAQWTKDAVKVAECGPGAEAGLRLTCTLNKKGTILNIPQANFSTRGFYYASCVGHKMFTCRESIQLVAPEYVSELDAGDRLEVDLHIPKAVVIEFTGFRNSSTVELCRVDGRLQQCLPGYQQRVLIIGNSFILTDMMPSNSGNYSVREEDHTLLSVSHVTVTERSSRVRIPTSSEREKNDLKHFFISTVNDIRESWIWKEGYQKGNVDGYREGMGTGALAAGIYVGLVCVIAVFIHRVFVGLNVCPPQIRFDQVRVS